MAAVRYQPLPPTCHPERSEGSRYVPIVIHRLLNTSRQGGRHSEVRLFRCSSGLHPAPFRSGTKEGAQNFLCPLEGNAAKQQRVYEVNHVNETLLLFHAARRLARLGNSMQNCHLRKEPDVTCFAAASYAAGCVE